MNNIIATNFVSQQLIMMQILSQPIEPIKKADMLH